MRKVAFVLCAAAMLVMAPALAARAADLQMTFSGPVALPGVALPGGSYVFRVVTPGVVQVLSKDLKSVYAMTQTMPIGRSEISKKVEATFAETRFDAPQRLHGWFRPWEATGHALIYPTQRPIDVGLNVINK